MVSCHPSKESLSSWVQIWAGEELKIAESQRQKEIQTSWDQVYSMKQEIWVPMREGSLAAGKLHDWIDFRVSPSESWSAIYCLSFFLTLTYPLFTFLLATGVFSSTSSFYRYLFWTPIFPPATTQFSTLSHQMCQKILLYTDHFNSHWFVFWTEALLTLLTKITKDSSIAKFNQYLPLYLTSGGVLKNSCFWMKLTQQFLFY